ncbi:DUF7373 family lipoprotein [Gordonia hydrophobica]|uniref:PTS sugar transporter subunit IIA n=1 Tax=Gordonia hydrophobica TaxID=40516 RepID=A0ABZ2U335_9ACTN|nr:hypothetical protein [Gordonia hydrophobica]MBM7369151.1 hypothetical protein [Gordonia hydrophobica]
MNGKRVVPALAAGLSIVLLAACSVDGTPTRGPLDLDTGKYQTSLAQPAGTATTDAELDKLRAVRLGESLVYHDDVDPQLNRTSMPTYPVTPASGLSGIISDVNDEPFMKALRYGFSVAAGSKDDDNDKGYNHAVFVFTDAAAANTAADALADALLKSRGSGERTRTRVPGAPTQMRAVNGKTSKGFVTAALTPVGDKVVYTWADSSDAAWTATTVRVSYEKQKALLDGMKPISDDPRIDPDGMLRGVLPVESGSRLSNMVLGPRTVALLANKPTEMYDAGKKAGITAAVVGDALVLKAGSDQQATEYLKTLSDQSGDPTARKAASPQDLASATCYTSKSSYGSDSADCYLAVGKYVVQASDSELLAAQQMASAEYLLLSQL